MSGTLHDAPPRDEATRDAAQLYFDHAATTPVDPEVARAMADCLAAGLGNPAATHPAGRAARERLEAARAEIARTVGAEEPAAIVFTSGATEADNLAILGIARAHADRARHVITARTEHRAVLDACARVEREGGRVTYLSTDRAGRIDVAQVRDALRPDTVLVSLMLVNNETGLVHDLAPVGALCRERGVAFHVDAAQAVGRVPLDVQALGADLVALSAHKCHGPAGVGALYVRRRPRPALLPLQFGGGQEGGLRSGTPPLHQAVGMAEAYRLLRERHPDEPSRLAALRDRLWTGLAPLGGLHRNGDPERSAPHILSVSVEGVDGEALVAALDDLALASGAACSSATREPSYVLRALGRDDPLAQATLRLSLGRTTTTAQVDRAVERVGQEVRRLRALAPGPLEPAESGRDWIEGEAREPLTGTHVRWRLRVVGGRIVEARWRARGCPHTLAACEIVATRLHGLVPGDLRLDTPGIAQAIGAPPDKLGRLFVIEDALQGAALQVRPSTA
ncbi:MAG: aminotransferase class V-fold PLP-dependent enzyme [Steroidobacteraceae bacterium]|nr:aminotransferase class V-fold PLP-dependent enzyme [Steroidobacteraceae bacterium]